MKHLYYKIVHRKGSNYIINNLKRNVLLSSAEKPHNPWPWLIPVWLFYCQFTDTKYKPEKSGAEKSYEIIKNFSSVCFSYKLPNKKWKNTKDKKGADGSGLLEDFLKGSKAIWFIRSEFSFGADLGYWKTLSKVSAYFSAPN